MRTDQPFWSGRSFLDLAGVALVTLALSFLAIPSFRSTYRERSFDYLARTALAEVTQAQKYHYQIYRSFIPCDELSCASKLSGVDYVPLGVKLRVEAEGTKLHASAFHLQGSGQRYTLHVAAG